jgi:hypothetical protein
VRLVRRTFAATFAATLLVAAPAAAGEVIVVDGNQAARVSDPTVPSRAEISLGSPEGGRATLGLATAASARTARTEARAARAWGIA